MVVEPVSDRRIQESHTQNKTSKKTKRQAQTRVVRVRAKRFKQGAIEKTEENPALVLSHNRPSLPLPLDKVERDCEAATADVGRERYAQVLFSHEEKDNIPARR
jgi:hypothetical protein